MAKLTDILKPTRLVKPQKQNDSINVVKSHQEIDKYFNDCENVMEITEENIEWAWNKALNAGEWGDNRIHQDYDERDPEEAGDTCQE